jgi:glycosyltransferase involved in cell wall biosynthesis
MAPSLATLITYYGEEYLLRECLDSLLKQSDCPDEILIYDDASSLPAKNYIPQDYPVKIVRGEVNCGPAFARNQLLKLSRCEYVHFHDADDLFHPNWCNKVKEAIDKTKADIVITEIASYKEGNLLSEKVMGLERLLDIQDLVKFGLMGSILIPSTTFRRDIALKIGGYRTREVLAQSEDFDFHIRLATTGATYTVITDPLIVQRIRDKSHSQDKKLCYASAIKSIELLSEELPREYWNELAEASARIGSVLYQMGANSEAKASFILASKIGKPYFSFQGKIYGFIARILGQNYAEMSGLVYRKILSEKFRRFIKFQLTK